MAETAASGSTPALSSTDALRLARVKKAMPAIMHRLEHSTLNDAVSLEGGTQDGGSWLNMAIGLSISQGGLPLWVRALRRLVPRNVGTLDRAESVPTPIVLNCGSSFIVGGLADTLAIFNLPPSLTRHVVRSMLRICILLVSHFDQLLAAMHYPVGEFVMHITLLLLTAHRLTTADDWTIWSEEGVLRWMLPYLHKLLPLVSTSPASDPLLASFEEAVFLANLICIGLDQRLPESLLGAIRLEKVVLEDKLDDGTDRTVRRTVSRLKGGGLLHCKLDVTWCIECGRMKEMDSQGKLVRFKHCASVSRTS